MPTFSNEITNARDFWIKKLPRLTTQKARQFITEMNGLNGEPFVYLIFADRRI